MAGASRVSLDTDRDDVLDTDPAVAAAGQPAARKHLVGEESVDELACDAQHLRCLGRADLIVNAEHDHPLTMSDVIQQRPDHTPYLGGVVHRRGKPGCSSPNPGVDGVQRRGEVLRHSSIMRANCNNSNHVRISYDAVPDSRITLAGTASSDAPPVLPPGINLMAGAGWISSPRSAVSMICEASSVPTGIRCP